MATKLYLRDSDTSGGTTGSDAMHDLLKAIGSSKVAYVKNTSAGTVTPPTSATQWTKTGGGTVCTWLSQPLVGLTISGTVTFNLWAFESASQANGTITAELYRCDSTGAIVSTIASATLARAELGTTDPPAAANNWNPSVTSRTLSTGDRLGVRVFMDDGNGVTMASGRTLTMRIDGTNAADGDSWVQVNETLQFAYTAPISETVSISESVAAIKRVAATPSEAVSISESVAGKYNAKATGLSETVSISDSTATIKRAAATPNETVSVGESVAEVYTPSSIAYQAPVSDSVSISESVATVFSTFATPSETVSISDSTVASRGMTEGLSDSTSVGESNAIIKVAVAPLSDSTSLSDSAASQFVGTQPLSDSVGLGDSTAVIKTTSVDVSDSTSVSESVATVKAATTDLSDSVTVAETLVGLYHVLASLVDSVGVAESRTSLFATFAAVSGLISLSDSIFVDTPNGPVELSGSFLLAESLSASRVSPIEQWETIGIAESLATLVTAAATLGGSVSLVESLSTTVRTDPELWETINVAEWLEIGSEDAQLDETIELAESVSVEQITPPIVVTVISLRRPTTTSAQISRGSMPTKVGNSFRSRVILYDLDGRLGDPTNVYCRVTFSEGSPTTYTYGVDEELQRDSMGRYHCDFPLTQAGRMEVEWWADDFNAREDESYIVDEA